MRSILRRRRRSRRLLAGVVAAAALSRTTSALSSVFAPGREGFAPEAPADRRRRRPPPAAGFAPPDRRREGSAESVVVRGGSSGDDEGVAERALVGRDGRRLATNEYASSIIRGDSTMPPPPPRRRTFLLSLAAGSVVTTTTTTFPTPSFAEEEDEHSPSSRRRPVAEEPDECKDGGLISESAVPGAYEQSCMNLDERRFALRTPGAGTLVVYQGTNTAGGGGVSGRTGVAVWNSGVLLTRLLDELALANPSFFEGRTVLELGCGAGLASVAAARLGASSVIATDANREVLDLARRNIERNDASNVARTAALQWGLMDASEFENAADVVIGSDLTYNSGSWVALAETMSTVLRPGGIVMYLSLGHAGFNVGGEVGGFLSVVGNMGLRVLARDDEEWRDGDIAGGRSIEELTARAIRTPEERGVIDSNGGVKVVLLGKKRAVRKG